MRDLIRSVAKLSVAMPLLAVKQVTGLWPSGETTKPSTSDELDSVTDALRSQLSDTAKKVYDKGDDLQRSLLGEEARGRSTPAAPEDAARAEATGGPVTIHSGDLDTRTIVVLGEGLAAGFGDFTLAEEFQKESFPSQLATQMGRELSQPRLESPGLGHAPGFPRLPVIVPALQQTTALTSFPGTPARNLSIPGFRVADATSLRPAEPIVQQADVRQTLANLILGLPDLLSGQKSCPTQLERAVSQQPTFAIVELGFHEVLEAAVAGRPADLPDVGAFRAAYARILTDLGAAGARTLILTIPDPLDTAYFSTLESAAANLKVEPSVLTDVYGFTSGDRVSVPGLMEMGFQLLANAIAPLPGEALLKAESAQAISARVQALNTALRSLAEENKQSLVFDLAALLALVKRAGVAAGGRRLTADFLGGFYLLNGYYPGATGHAVIANAILEHLNASCGARFEPIALEPVLERDPAAACRPAAGPISAHHDYKAPAGRGVTDVAGDAPSSRRATKRPKKTSSGSSWKPGDRIPLPPGLEQTLPLSRASYFGDAIRAANCRVKSEQMFGSGRELLFGGLALVDSHLSGEIRIRFSEPVHDVTRFQVFHGRLEGEDGTLAAPQFFKLPALRNEVRDDDTLVSAGELNLVTGRVTNLKYAVRFGNTALLALVRVNPKLPDIPIQFPGLYGSASAKFEPREDGLLDYTFYGTTFLPLGGAIEGDPVRFPLPLCGPTLEFASIPAAGTSLHPHLHLTTKEPEEAPDSALVPEIPVNTVREYTIFTRHTSFGDKFTLRSAEHYGDPTGRSHLLGRVIVQFGAPSGESVPIAVTCLTPGGLLMPHARTPLDEMFPGRLAPSPTGHNEFLRFATRTYYLDALTCIDDPFDVSVGNVSRQTGRLLGDLLHRALIGQNLFYALIRIEPRTPKASFEFRGPAHFEKGQDGRTLFRFAGQVNIEYPKGYLFPRPDMSTGVVVEAEAALDPFYWIQAVQHEPSVDAVARGERTNILSSANELFSYKYEISGDPARTPPTFEYTNHTANGTFRLRGLSWVSFVNSRGAGAGTGGTYDTVTFSGFGSWSRDDESRLHEVSAQISTASAAPYVSIQVGGGRVSNVNLKPENIEDVRP